jgi:CDP-glucose 4,6-dehydratase
VDAAKARAKLFWQPRLNLRDALTWTVDWAKRHIEGESAVALINEQISAYERRLPTTASVSSRGIQ